MGKWGGRIASVECSEEPILFVFDQDIRKLSRQLVSSRLCRFSIKATLYHKLYDTNDTAKCNRQYFTNQAPSGPRLMLLKGPSCDFVGASDTLMRLKSWAPGQGTVIVAAMDKLIVAAVLSRTFRVSIVTLFVAIAAHVAAHEIPAPLGYVSDFAGVIGSADEARIKSVAITLKLATGAEIAVATFASLEGYGSIEQMSLAVANGR